MNESEVVATQMGARLQLAKTYGRLDEQDKVFDTLQPIVTGTYLDRFEKVDGQWRFRERRELVGGAGDMSAHLLQDYEGPTGD